MIPAPSPEQKLDDALRRLDKLERGEKHRRDRERRERDEATVQQWREETGRV